MGLRQVGAEVVDLVVGCGWWWFLAGGGCWCWWLHVDGGGAILLLAVAEFDGIRVRFGFLDRVRPMWFFGCIV